MLFQVSMPLWGGGSNGIWHSGADEASNVLGAFTPGCSVRHLPGYIQNLPQIKSKGVDIIAVLAFNDPYVMSAWGKANGIKGDDIVSSLAIDARKIGHKLTVPQLFLTDPEAKFSKSIGWTRGERTGRYAMIIDHGKV